MGWRRHTLSKQLLILAMPSSTCRICVLIVYWSKLVYLLLLWHRAQLPVLSPTKMPAPEQNSIFSSNLLRFAVGFAFLSGLYATSRRWTASRWDFLRISLSLSLCSISFSVLFASSRADSWYTGFILLHRYRVDPNVAREFSRRHVNLQNRIMNDGKAAVSKRIWRPPGDNKPLCKY